MMTSSKITKIALLCALALVFGYIESLFPLPVPIPGIKLGLSNIVILYAILKLDIRTAFFIMLIKVTLSSLLFSGASSFIYSLAGGIFSTVAMLLISRFNFSIHGISISGGVMHNLGQLMAACLVLKSTAVFSYMPILLISGLVVGILTGTICKAVLRHLKSK